MKMKISDNNDMATFTVRLLSANVGNLSLSSMKYNNKLCKKDTETRIKNNILLLNPDIVLLQELIDPEQCERVQKNSPNSACYQFDKEKDPDQSVRLLGDNYIISRERRLNVGVEAIAIKKQVGNILGQMRPLVLIARMN